MTSASRDITKRPKGPGTPVLVRLQPADLAALDGWIREQPKIMTRPEAVRAILAKALG